MPDDRVGESHAAAAIRCAAEASKCAGPCSVRTWSVFAIVHALLEIADAIKRAK